jgi:hypothetical protein
MGCKQCEATQRDIAGHLEALADYAALLRRTGRAVEAGKLELRVSAIRSAQTHHPPQPEVR